MTTDRLDALIRAHQRACAAPPADGEWREAADDLWRGADAAWARVQHSLCERLARSTRRLQARLDHRAAR